MAIQAVFDLKLLEQRFITWKFVAPDNREELSHYFTIQNISCHLRFKEDHSLYFESTSPLGPMHVLVCSWHGTGSMPRQRKQNAYSKSIIWECSHRKMASFTKKCRASIRTGDLLRFEIYIRLGDIPKDGFDTFKRRTHTDNIPGTSARSDFNNCFDSLSQDLGKLLEDDSSQDVEIKCQEQTFKAHRLLLSTRSEVFATMLKSDMVEGHTGQVNIEDMEAGVFEDFLQYLYTGKLPEMNLLTVRQLYEAADKYDVQGLSKKCASLLSQNLTDDIACDILVLADTHSDLQLKENVFAYIVKRNIPREKNSEFSDFANIHPKLALEAYDRYVVALK